MTPSGAWERYYLFRHEVASGWYAHDPPEGWIGLRADEADAAAHTFQDDAIVLYEGRIHVSSNYVAPDPDYVTRRYEAVVPKLSVYGRLLASDPVQGDQGIGSGRTHKRSLRCLTEVGTVC